jgi:hypothetical protein
MVAASRAPHVAAAQHGLATPVGAPERLRERQSHQNKQDSLNHAIVIDNAIKLINHPVQLLRKINDGKNKKTDGKR